VNFLNLNTPGRKIDLLNIIMPLAQENVAYKTFFCKFYFLVGNTWDF